MTVALGIGPAATEAPAQTVTPARVVATWPAGPLEVRLAFDGPVDPTVAAKLVGTSIRFNLEHRTVDRWRREGARPPSSPPGALRVAGSKLEDGGQTLVLATDPHPREAVYRLDLPDPTSGGRPAPVDYDLTGISAIWDTGEEGAPPAWSGWWPELDPEASRRQTRGSAEHERGFALLAKPGRLTLSTLVVLPPGPVKLRVASTVPLEGTLGGENPSTMGKDRLEFAFESTGDPTDLTLIIPTQRSQGPPRLNVTYTVGDDPAERALTREAQVVPWAPSVPPAPAEAPAPPFELSGGDPARGEAVFLGEQAKCSACHKVGGKGGTVGPDLTNQAGRKLADVYRDVADPSATINPEFVAFTVATKDGRVVVGVVRAEGFDAIRVVDTDAKATEVRRSDIEEFRASPTSIMPVGLVGVLGEDKLRDLLAFLTSRPGSGPPAAKP